MTRTRLLYEQDGQLQLTELSHDISECNVLMLRYKGPDRCISEIEFVMKYGKDSIIFCIKGDNAPFFALYPNGHFGGITFNSSIFREVLEYIGCNISDDSVKGLGKLLDKLSDKFIQSDVFVWMNKITTNPF